jgi:hypothetical protein
METSSVQKESPIDLLMTQLYKKGFLKEVDGNEPINLMTKAKEMEIAGKEMSYADGYKEGYNRAIELTKWAISNLIPPHNEQR